jgi:hypothetical protein
LINRTAVATQLRHPRVLLLPQSAHSLAHMSCRTAVNMTKRAAAGAISASVWLEEEALAPLHVDPPKLSRSKKTQIVGYQRTSRTLMAFSVIAALSLVSYATYAHQWAELSALRHLGQTSPR